MGRVRMRSGSCPRQQMPPNEPFRSMWRAMATPLPIAAALILLPAIAFASPPDPSWIAGIYDGADGDDIVTLVCETAASNPAVLAYVAPLPCLSVMTPERLVRGFPVDRVTPGSRAPPLLCSPVSAYVFTSLLHDRPPPRVRKIQSPASRSPNPMSSGGATSMSSPAAKSCPGGHSPSSSHDVTDGALGPGRQKGGVGASWPGATAVVRGAESMRDGARSRMVQSPSPRSNEGQK